MDARNQGTGIPEQFTADHVIQKPSLSTGASGLVLDNAPYGISEGHVNAVPPEEFGYRTGQVYRRYAPFSGSRSPETALWEQAAGPPSDSSTTRKILALSNRRSRSAPHRASTLISNAAATI